MPFWLKVDQASWAISTAATGGLPSLPVSGISFHELSDRAWEFLSKVVCNVKKCEATENTEKICAATMEAKVTAGPMFSRDEVSVFVGTDQWIPTQRFEVVRNNKVRGVGQWCEHGHNDHGKDRTAIYRCQCRCSSVVAIPHQQGREDRRMGPG